MGNGRLILGIRPVPYTWCLEKQPMQAIIYRRYGAPDVLEYQGAPQPHGNDQSAIQL